MSLLRRRTSPPLPLSSPQPPTLQLPLHLGLPFLRRDITTQPLPLPLYLPPSVLPAHQAPQNQRNMRRPPHTFLRPR